MNAVPFDTLKMARHLHAAGFTTQQANGAAEALADALSGADLATKGDVVSLKAEVKAEINSLRTGLGHEVAGLRAEVKNELVALQTELNNNTSSLRTELKAGDAGLHAQMSREFALMRRDMEVLRRDLTIKLGGMIFLAVGIILTAFRYMPPHP
ncbi:MAG: hypothetical protein JO227_04185 [Acetobacteraceae bacterium]|nr:hypothetical protein [Acetobacteraceae bacterium]